jgi:hypothetical protein
MSEGRRLIEELVTEVSPNATVAGIDERGDVWRVTIAGTTSLLARCDVPRDTLDAATTRPEVRDRVARLLERCADDVVAEIPDGRG